MYVKINAVIHAVHSVIYGTSHQAMCFVRISLVVSVTWPIGI